MGRSRTRKDLSSVPVTASMPAGLIPCGYEQITVLTSSTALTVPAGASYAQLIAEGAALRWRDDGVAPTASVGMPLPVNAELRYDGDLSAFRVIQQGSGGVLNVAYYG